MDFEKFSANGVAERRPKVEVTQLKELIRPIVLKAGLKGRTVGAAEGAELIGASPFGEI